MININFGGMMIMPGIYGPGIPSKLLNIHIAINNNFSNINEVVELREFTRVYHRVFIDTWSREEYL